MVFIGIVVYLFCYIQFVQSQIVAHRSATDELAEEAKDVFQLDSKAGLYPMFQPHDYREGGDYTILDLRHAALGNITFVGPYVNAHTCTTHTCMRAHTLTRML